MERDTENISPYSDLEILGYCLDERITPLPAAQDGKLVLWYGSEWEEYDEPDPTAYDQQNGMSRYPAGAYFETIALRPEVIQNPSYIADAALRINQLFDDKEFIAQITDGMYSNEVLSDEHAKATLFAFADNGKAGCWPMVFDEGHFSSEFSDEQLAELVNLDKNFHDWMVYEAHLVPMDPAELGRAIAKCIPEEWLNTISARLTELLNN